MTGSSLWQVNPEGQNTDIWFVMDTFNFMRQIGALQLVASPERAAPSLETLNPGSTRRPCCWDARRGGATSQQGAGPAGAEALADLAVPHRIRR